jgi:DegV family protein with EDD domain
LKRVAVITDSIACLTPDQVIQNRIEIVPLYIRYGDHIYRDGIDITPTQAYELFLKNPDSFTTSAATPADFLAAYRKTAEQTDAVICITLSAKLSTTYNSAILAKEYVLREFPRLNIEVMDSQTATASEGMVVLAGVKAAESGAALHEVLSATQSMRSKVGSLVLLETIKHVYRSGRVPKIAAQAGSILNIHPLFSINGRVNLIGVARTFDRGIDRMIEKIKSEVNNKPVNVAVMHAYAPDPAKSLLDRLARELNCRDIWLTEFSPLMGYACGTGTLGIAYTLADG